MTGNGQTITLQSPQSTNFETYIIGNAEQYVKSPYETYGQLLNLIVENVKQGIPSVVRENSHAGETLILCGAGPSLAENVKEYCTDAKYLWGCNSAVTWLADKGYKPTHAFTIDQGPEMLQEWGSLPDVEYLLATTTHPHLTQLLRSHGKSVRYFHNFVGIKKAPVQWPDEYGEERRMSYEQWQYALLFPGTIMAGSGLNSVTRAIDVAVFMGFEKIIVLGADCAIRLKRRKPDAPFGSAKHRRWLENATTMHVDGSNALRSGATPLTLGGEIDGTWWESKPDLLVTASCIVQMKKKYGDRLEIIGNTLPNAIMEKGQDFLDRMPQLMGSDGAPLTL